MTSNPALPDLRYFTIDAFAQGFLGSSVLLIDNPHATIAARYGYVLEHLKEARTRKVYASFEDAFERVYTTGTPTEMAAAIELARLQYFFYMTLYNNRSGRAHVNVWHATNAEKWVLKLNAKFTQTKMAVVDLDERTYKPHKFPDKVTHQWLN